MRRRVSAACELEDLLWEFMVQTAGALCIEDYADISDETWRREYLRMHDVDDVNEQTFETWKQDCIRYSPEHDADFDALRQELPQCRWVSGVVPPFYADIEREECMSHESDSPDEHDSPDERDAQLPKDASFFESFFHEQGLTSFLDAVQWTADSIPEDATWASEHVNLLRRTRRERRLALARLAQRDSALDTTHVLHVRHVRQRCKWLRRVCCDGTHPSVYSGAVRIPFPWPLPEDTLSFAVDRNSSIDTAHGQQQDGGEECEPRRDAPPVFFDRLVARIADCFYRFGDAPRPFVEDDAFAVENKLPFANYDDSRIENRLRDLLEYIFPGGAPPVIEDDKQVPQDLQAEILLRNVDLRDVASWKERVSPVPVKHFYNLFSFLFAAALHEGYMPVVRAFAKNMDAFRMFSYKYCGRESIGYILKGKHPARVLQWIHEVTESDPSYYADLGDLNVDPRVLGEIGDVQVWRDTLFPTDKLSWPRVYLGNMVRRAAELGYEEVCTFLEDMRVQDKLEGNACVIRENDRLLGACAGGHVALVRRWMGVWAAVASVPELLAPIHIFDDNYIYKRPYSAADAAKYVCEKGIDGNALHLFLLEKESWSRMEEGRTWNRQLFDMVAAAVLNNQVAVLRLFFALKRGDEDQPSSFSSSSSSGCSLFPMRACSPAAMESLMDVAIGHNCVASIETLVTCMIQRVTSPLDPLFQAKEAAFIVQSTLWKYLTWPLAPSEPWRCPWLTPRWRSATLVRWLLEQVRVIVPIALEQEATKCARRQTNKQERAQNAAVSVETDEASGERGGDSSGSAPLPPRYRQHRASMRDISAESDWTKVWARTSPCERVALRECVAANDGVVWRDLSLRERIAMLYSVPCQQLADAIAREREAVFVAAIEGDVDTVMRAVQHPNRRIGWLSRRTSDGRYLYLEALRGGQVAVADALVAHFLTQYAAARSSALLVTSSSATATTYSHGDGLWVSDHVLSAQQWLVMFPGHNVPHSSNGWTDAEAIDDMWHDMAESHVYATSLQAALQHTYELQRLVVNNANSEHDKTEAAAEAAAMDPEELTARMMVNWGNVVGRAVWRDQIQVVIAMSQAHPRGSLASLTSYKSSRSDDKYSLPTIQAVLHDLFLEGEEDAKCQWATHMLACELDLSFPDGSPCLRTCRALLDAGANVFGPDRYNRDKPGGLLLVSPYMEVRLFCLQYVLEHPERIPPVVRVELSYGGCYPDNDRMVACILDALPQAELLPAGSASWYHSVYGATSHRAPLLAWHRRRRRDAPLTILYNSLAQRRPDIENVRFIVALLW